MKLISLKNLEQVVELRNEHVKTCDITEFKQLAKSFLSKPIFANRNPKLHDIILQRMQDENITMEDL